MNKTDAVIDYLLRKGPNANGERLSHIALQKLLYFIEGWSYPLLGGPLTGATFQAWTHGPVAPDQYRRLARFGAAEIPADFADCACDSALNDEEKGLIDEVWRKYAVANPWTLVEITHLEGSPWHTVRREHGVEWGGSCQIEIPADHIGAYFCDLYRQGRDLRIAAAVDHHERLTATARDEEQAMLAAEWAELAGAGVESLTAGDFGGGYAGHA